MSAPYTPEDERNDNSGRTFVTAQQAAERDLRRHRQEPRDFAVEADGQWPRLHTAFEAISHDSGNGVGHAVYFVPDVWAVQIDGIEGALARLSPEDFERFCLPTDDEDGLIAGSNPDLHAANRLLGAFFDDWSEEPAEPAESLRANRQKVAGEPQQNDGDSADG